MSISVAEQCLKDGRLDEALVQLQNQARQQPANAKYRIFLFQLLAILGQWDRSLNQLKVCGELDPASLAMVHTYREAIRCEILRAKVFAGDTSPLIFGHPEQWLANLVAAVTLTAKGQYAQAVDLRSQAFELAPPTPGSVNQQPFAWLADADSRLGPVLEAIVNGRYYWIPFNRLAKVTLEAPSDLRDFVWMPAELTWANGGASAALIPTRYPGTEKLSDAALLLSRMTQWNEVFPNQFHGLGQRVLTTDAADYSLMEIRELVFNPDFDEQNG